MTAISSSVTGLYVGTSGWSYPSWKGFYPPETKPAEFLRYYAERLPSVELNTTGYRLPAEGQFERWAAATPPGFRFAPKLNAYRLSDFATFEERTWLLGDRLGPIRVLVGSARDEGFLQLRSARSTHSFRSRSTSATTPGPGSRPGPLRTPCASTTSRQAPFRYLRLREPPLLGCRGCANGPIRIRPSEGGVEVHCYFRHEDEPTCAGIRRASSDLVSLT